MRKIISIASGIGIIAFTVCISFFLFEISYSIFSKYYEAFSSVFISDYFEFKNDFGRFYLGWFVGLRIIIPLIGIYYLFSRIRSACKRNSERLPFKNLRQWLDQSSAYIRLFHVAFIFCIFLFAEKYLENQGYSPGLVYKYTNRINGFEDKSTLMRCDSLGIMRKSQSNPAISWGHINNDGFRCSYEFDSASIMALKKQGKKLAMVIGDSYTEGFTANPHDSCFVSLLDKNPRYSALNFGVWGTDPLQYKLIAGQYVSAIRPDIVIIVTCANDIMQYDRIPQSGIPILYHTILSQKPMGLGYKANDVFKSKKEANEFYKKYNEIPPSFLGQLCSTRNLTTRIWLLLHPNHPVIPEPGSTTNLPFTYNNLKAVQNLCDSLSIPVLFFHIPDVSEISKADTAIIQAYHPYFKDLPLHYMFGLSVNDHVSETRDKHFNNRGHAKFAAFMVNVLDSTFLQKN